MNIFSQALSHHQLMLKELLGLARKKPPQYMYLVPGEGNTATWEILEQAELERRITENLLAEGCRLFVLDKELKVRFERLTHIEQVSPD